jgi:hypothetical protein
VPAYIVLTAATRELSSPERSDRRDTTGWSNDGEGMPYIYIDKVLNELRTELLSAMHAAVQREVRKGEVDVNRLYRAFTRAAAGKCANPVRVSERCIASDTGKSKRASGNASPE